jgi:hypothetical protein
MAYDYLHSVRASDDIEFDCSHLPVTGMDVAVTVDNGKTLKLHAGSTASWNTYSSSNKLVSVSGPALVRVRRSSQNQLWCIADVGTLSNSNTAAAVRSSSVAWLGQSEHHRCAAESGHWGFCREREVGFLSGSTGLGLSRSVWGIDAAFGASRVLKSSPSSIADNYWWDTDTDSAGPRTTDCIAAILADIAAGQPAPSALFWLQWQADVSGADATRIALWAPDTKKVLDAVRVGIGSANLPVILALPGSDDIASEGSGVYTAMREALLGLCVDADHIYRGPDSYGLSRTRPYNDFHMDYDGQVIYAARMARHHANVVNGQSNFVGPRITACNEVSNGDGTSTYTVVIDAGSESLNRPTNPSGFAFLDAGSAVGQTPADMGVPSWSGNNVVFTGPSGKVMHYPWGCMGPEDHAGRVITSKTTEIELGSWKP